MQSRYVPLTPCPPRKRCRVCEARVDHALSHERTASKAAKYRHQMEWWSRAALRAVVERDVLGAEAFATRAASYAGLMWEEEAKTQAA